MDDLAQAAGPSPAHFSREFRRAFCETPHQYLLARRLERAAALLRTTDRSVAGVCLSVGLQSVGSFTEKTAGRRRASLPLNPQFAGTVFLTTDDCEASYEEPKARGVEFTDEPTDRPYVSTPDSATRPGTRCASRRSRISRSPRPPDLTHAGADPTPSRRGSSSPPFTLSERSADKNYGNRSRQPAR